MPNPSPFRCFNTSPEMIRLAVMLYVRFPLSLRNVEDLLHERGVDICHETVRQWWMRFEQIFAAEILRRRASRQRVFRRPILTPLMFSRTVRCEAADGGGVEADGYDRAGP